MPEVSVKPQDHLVQKDQLVPSSKAWLKIALITGGALIFTLSVLGAYWLGTQNQQSVKKTEKTIKVSGDIEQREGENLPLQDITPTERPKLTTPMPTLTPAISIIYQVTPQATQAGKLYLTVKGAEVKKDYYFSFTPEGKQILFLEVIFENRNAIEGENATDADLRFAINDFRLTDAEGFIQDWVIPNSTIQEELKVLGVIEFVPTLAHIKLARGEKFRGYLLAIVPKDASGLSLTGKTAKFSLTPQK